MSRKIIIGLAIVILVAIIAFISTAQNNFEVLASGLDTPWEILFLPSGDLLVTERPGTLRVFGRNPATITVPGVVEEGEGGLHGAALHPNFSANRLLYLYYTTENQGQKINRVVRFVFDGKSLSSPQMVIDKIPAGTNHNGGRIAFGPDRRLYITTGDAGNENLPQDINSLAGKILRLDANGTVPIDNPFKNAVYSYGHRNPQGLAWDQSGGMWSTEHGRSGVQSGLDEINYIEAGANYGWPLIEGDETRIGMRTPVLNSGPNQTWAPAGIIAQANKIYFVGLRGQALFEAVIASPGQLSQPKEYFKNEFGRLRAITANRGRIYLATSNRDGRGNPNPADDRVLSIQISSQ